MDRVRTIVTCGVLVSLVGAPSRGWADEKPMLPEQVYFRVSDNIYMFETLSAHDAGGGLGESFVGCDELRVRQAVFAGGRAERGFAFKALPAAAQLDYLGANAADVLRETGRDIGQAQLWRLVVSHRLCRSASGIRIEQDTGADRVVYRFPWEAAAGNSSAPHDGVSIEVSVNDWTESIPAARAFDLSRKLAAGSDLGGEPLPSEFLALGQHMNDPSAYGRTLYGLLWASAEIDSRYTWPSAAAPQGGYCGWTCFQCGVLGAGLIVGGTAVLVAGCGASVGTLGTSCVAAGTGYMAALFALMDKCLECCVCQGACTKGDKNGGGKDEDGCPAGYHACCDVNSCCSDANPPQCCHPPCV